MNLDRLYSVPVDKTAQATFAVFDALQHERFGPAEQRVAAMFCAAYLAARRYGISPMLGWDFANNIIWGTEGKQQAIEFAGAKRYLKEEF